MKARAKVYPFRHRSRLTIKKNYTEPENRQSNSENGKQRNGTE